MVAKKKKNVKKKAAKKVRSKKSIKKVTRKKAKKKKSAKQSKKPQAQEFISKKRVLGMVTHYFPHVQAAVVKLKKPLGVGDTILVKGSTTHFEQEVTSMQIDHNPIEKAKKGDEVGLQVKERVREHDLILLP